MKLSRALSKQKQRKTKQEIGFKFPEETSSQIYLKLGRSSEQDLCFALFVFQFGFGPVTQDFTVLSRLTVNSLCVPGLPHIHAILPGSRVFFTIHGKISSFGSNHLVFLLSLSTMLWHRLKQRNIIPTKPPLHFRCHAPGLWRLRQEDIKFDVSLDDVERLCVLRNK